MSEKLIVESEITLEQIQQQLTFLGDKTIYKFIVELDELVSDWEFTERLYRHFKELHEEFQKTCDEVREEICDEVREEYLNKNEDYCKFCGLPKPISIMHLHQDRYVCGDCWDERLRSTE
jgi:ribosomal protein S27AE